MVAASANAAFAETKIGVAAIVQNQVFGSDGQLSVGSSVHAQEVIKTGEASSASLQFLDQTNLNIGPKSEVRLDKFVYDPNKNNGNVVINTGKGVFRFVSGAQDSKSYTINTPVATIGVRGTAFYVMNWGGHSAVIQHFGHTVIHLHNGGVINLPQGHSLIISSNGHHEVFNSKETSNTLHKSGIDQSQLQQYSNFIGQPGNPMAQTNILPPVEPGGGPGGHHHHHHHHNFGYHNFGHHHHHHNQWAYFGHNRHHHHHNFYFSHNWNGNWNN